MTTIAWDGRTLAADKMAVYNDLKRTATKIFKVGNELVGYCGVASFGNQMLEWYKQGAVLADFPQSQRDKDDWQVFFVIALGEPVRVYERTPYPILFEDAWYACGSGRDYALGAMLAGQTAEQAVRIACELDCNSGMGIDTLRFEGESV